MFQVQGPTKQTCTLLAILSGSNHESKPKLDENPKLPFPDITSSGRLEVQLLKKPRIEEIRKVLDSSQPNIVYLQGEILENNEIGSLIWDNADLSTVEALSEIFNNTLPTTVYLEIPNGEKLGEALRAKGVPYVIYWKNTVSSHSAGHFRHALFSVIQSSSCHTWDAFQLAEASYKLYCGGNNRKSGQGLMGEPPKNMVPRTEMANNNIDDEEGSSEAQSAINIYDDDVTIKFLICGAAKILDMSLLGSLEDGLNALLNIEIRGSKVHNRVSALPPPLHAANFSRGVVTMRCDVSTSSSAHISLLISGSADTCFDDQLLENHIKSEIIEKSEMTHVLKSCDELLSEPRKSDSIACGASVYEVTVRIPSWASQILRQLAPDTSYRSLVALGIASIQGLSVSAFEKDDTERLLFFSTNQPNETNENCTIGPPAWLRPPPPTRRRSDITQNGNKLHSRQKLKAAALRPIPHIHHQKMLPFTIGLEERNDGNTLTKPSVPTAPMTHHRNNSAVAAPVTSHRKSTSAFQAKQIISLNPLPLKKHGCGRSPMHMCAENDFLKDVMQFLILRGHTRLIPQGGVSEFPDAILNAKRLDLYNLYREVVSRGGFHVGNGINWKGQVFSKMRNHTATNRMTGVGNTLKRHYETYLLEYELAHDDVDGECCLLCHSSAAGDWVNCGICGEWAHLGCDRRPGLGTFKDYAKTDGLEYICPQCSISNMKKKMQKTNGYS